MSPMLLWCQAELLLFPGRLIITPVVCDLQQSGFIHVVVLGERPLKHLHNGLLLGVLGGRGGNGENCDCGAEGKKVHCAIGSMTHMWQHMSAALNTNGLHFGVETGTERVVGEVGLRQAHLLQDGHFLLDHRPALEFVEKKMKTHSFQWVHSNDPSGFTQSQNDSRTASDDYRHQLICQSTNPLYIFFIYIRKKMRHKTLETHVNRYKRLECESFLYLGHWWSRYITT